MKFADYIARKRAEHGTSFDPADLAEQFIPYFESGQRVRVQLSFGETLTGTIGVTTGRRPVFLLMRTSRAIGSPWTLNRENRVIAVQRGRQYVPTT